MEAKQDGDSIDYENSPAQMRESPRGHEPIEDRSKEEPTRLLNDIYEQKLNTSDTSRAKDTSATATGNNHNLAKDKVDESEKLMNIISNEGERPASTAQPYHRNSSSTTTVFE